MEEIKNKVAESGLITIDLEEYYPREERIVLDIKDQLFQGLVLKEKDFREYIQHTDWTLYKNKFVAIVCSADAIVPTWAYMLLASALQPHAKKIIFGNLEELETAIFNGIISGLDPQQYKDARVIIKGCSKVPVPVSAYVELTTRLRPYVKSIMYGEPCSTVPVYKKQ